MTTTANDRRKEYPGNGVTTTFDGPRYASSSELQVRVINDTTGAATTPSYTLSAPRRGRPTVVTITPAPASGTTVQILRVVDYKQVTDLTNMGAYQPEVVEDGMDALARQIEQLADRDQRSVRLSDSLVATGFNGELPALTALAPIVVNASRTGFEMGSTELTGDMLLRPNLAAATGGALVGYQQDGVGAALRSTLGKAGETLSVLDYIDSQYYAAIFAGTSTYDAAPAIQKAINAATGLFSTGKPVDGLGLRYYCNSAIELKANTHLRNLTCQVATGATLGNISVGGGFKWLYNAASGVSNVTLERCRFLSSKTGFGPTMASIALQNITGLTVDRCTFKDWGDATHYNTGFQVFASSGVQITGSTFDNCSGDGCALSSGTTDYVVRGCVFTNNLDWGLALVQDCHRGTVTGNRFQNNTSTATGVDRCVDVTFTGNTMISCEHGIRLCRFATTTPFPTGITVSGNAIKSCTTGVSVEDCGTDAAISVTGNTIKDCPRSVQWIDTQGGTITGNTIIATINEAILLQANPGGTCGLVSISGNTIKTCTYGIRQLNSGGTLADCAIGPNTITGASVAKTALVAIANSIVGVTAPTLLNSWANAGGANAPAGYYKDGNGRVYLQGRVAGGLLTQEVFTLPVGFRPAATVSFPVVSNGAFGWAYVTALGNVYAQAGSNVAFNLDGIDFLAA